MNTNRDRNTQYRRSNTAKNDGRREPAQRTQSKGRYPAKKSGKKKKKSFEWLQALLEALVIVFILYFLCWPLKIDGKSMEPVFKTGDRIIVSRVMAVFGFIGRGDTVVCTVEDGGSEVDVVKRIIGIPGDVVTIKDGVVTVNGNIVNEPYITGGTYPDDFKVLGSDEYYIMGDNRVVSTDSRNFGPISKGAVKARVILKLYPFGEFKISP